MRTRGDEYKFYSRETGLSIGSAILGASALVVFIGTSSPLFSKKVDTDFYGSLHIPIAIVLMLVNGLSLILKWRQSSAREMLKKSLWSFALATVLTGGFYWVGIRDFNYDLIILTALFALFVNIEVAYKLLKGKFVVSLSKVEGETKRRILGAVKWTFSLGLLAMLIGTKGDYYKFGDVIVNYGVYWLAFTLVVAGAFVMFGSVRFKADTRFIGAYVAHAGIALFILGVVASSHYEEKSEFSLKKGEKAKAFGRYEFSYAGYTMLPPQDYHFMINIRDNDGTVETAQPVLFLSAFDDFKSWNPKPSIVKYASRDVYFTMKGIEVTGGPPKDSLTKGESKTFFGGKYDVTFEEFDFSQEERAKMMSQQPFRVKAKIMAKKKDDPASAAIPLELSVTRSLASDDTKMEDVNIPGTKLHLQLSELKPDLQDRSKSKIFIQSFNEDDPPPPMSEAVLFEAFIKPYINLVWAGVLILVTGFGFAMMRRRREALTAIDKAEKAFEKMKAVRAASDEPRSAVAPSHSAKTPLKKKERV
jgi:cytochrome c-type biogenesis protein CcmF